MLTHQEIHLELYRQLAFSVCKRFERSIENSLLQPPLVTYIIRIIWCAGWGYVLDKQISRLFVYRIMRPVKTCQMTSQICNITFSCSNKSFCYQDRATMYRFRWLSCAFLFAFFQGRIQGAEGLNFSLTWGETCFSVIYVKTVRCLASPFYVLQLCTCRSDLILCTNIL